MLKITAISIPLVAASLLAGCGHPDARFVYNERTDGLISEASQGNPDQGQSGVKPTLDSRFGTPNDLVAWMRLPVDFGGDVGTTGASTVPGATRSLDVSFSSESPSIPDGATLTWLSGLASGTTMEIQSYDGDAHQLRLTEVLPSPPAEGTEFVVDFGDNLRNGRSLYMTHCAHCHGTSGDGNGPTARYLNPKPRDYRKGIFKFTSTLTTEKVSRDDLQRLVRQGVPGTYMPSFMLLKDDELHAIVEYVRWLAMRGEYELKLAIELEDSYSRKSLADRTKGGESRSEILNELQQYLAGDFKAAADAAGTDLQEQWERADAEESVIVPTVARTEDSPESRHRGRQLFLSAKAKCSNCHGPQGLGDGPQTEDFEEDQATRQKREIAGLHDDWGNLVRPRNLKSGVYRGGRRPIDIYRRIYAGIKGAKMPAFGGSVLNDQEIWDLVNYVLSIPWDGRPKAVSTSPQGHAETSTPATIGVIQSLSH